jgi:hypothetical protein
LPTPSKLDFDLDLDLDLDPFSLSFLYSSPSLPLLVRFFNFFYTLL